MELKWNGRGSAHIENHVARTVTIFMVRSSLWRRYTLSGKILYMDVEDRGQQFSLVVCYGDVSRIRWNYTISSANILEMVLHIQYILYSVWFKTNEFNYSIYHVEIWWEKFINLILCTQWLCNKFGNFSSILSVIQVVLFSPALKPLFPRGLVRNRIS